MSTVFPSPVALAREDQDRDAQKRNQELNREHFVREAFKVFPNGLPDGTMHDAFVAASPAQKVEILRLLAAFPDEFDENEETKRVYRVLEITLSAFEADIPTQDEFE